MIRRKHKLEMPELNTTSTADISFMLLIFFLVVSSMDIDKGLTRQLPPMEKEHVVEETFVNKEHLLALEITENDQLLIDGQAAQMKAW
ncbi:MAG: biopolymer transporter ExbD [Prevotella sp.]|nr:biopolymer transporter ExbD [Prevotella sp.]